ncbi:mechanosensitive ion channel family protein [Flocculibacter collagenilyticus]|uniref:mechanosensitive ion channel family protein n=1 Tax=Flocculibacter collagenilyticus TaxID=2744479 RepID=UPI001F36E8E8|nr:mechanosensitive ion channel domain-containing protein [Flocculibacter collagenilyticus]
MEIFLEYKIATTAVLITLSVIAKFLIIKHFKKSAAQQKQDKRHEMNTSRNVANLVLFLSLLLLWSVELQKFALSIAAFMVAIVLATKEVIQCFIGFIYLSSTNPFRVGDWIQTNNFTGEVMATDWAKVTISEVDLNNYEYTGKTVFIPNSQLMTQPIKNLNFMRRYVNHSFYLVREDADVDPYIIKQALTERAMQYCANFAKVGERYNTLIENRLDIKISGPEPSVKFTTTDLGKVKVSFSVFCPVKQVNFIEQKLTADFFSMWQKEKQRAEALKAERDAKNIENVPTTATNEARTEPQA